ncbi:protein CROWDED NUCLEI 4-like [Hevea brasiliensis]|uniref:protein CROWDED NUCLEI 4-like n=1 Tax=Hevea brasiliensis TaxID=3981 RepID=UPI0025CE3FE3|nr:protein CROWDED NUCLEI 4-like [Hevea brasiliensis]
MLDNMEVAKIQQSNMESSLQKISAIRYLRSHSSVKDTDLVSREREDTANNGKRLDSPSMQKPVVDSARFSWIKRCTELIFKSSPEKPLLKSEEKSLISNNDDAILASAGKLYSSSGYHGQKLKSIESSGNRQPMRYAIGEPEVTPEPPEDETAKGKRDKESEKKKDANEEIAPSFSEQARPAGRKRRVKNSPLDVSTDPEPEQRQNIKRRRQQKGAAVNLSISKDANNPSVISTKINAPEDQHLTEGAEDADVVIAERIIKIFYQ